MQAAKNHEDSLNTAANLGLTVSDITNKKSENKKSHANSRNSIVTYCGLLVGRKIMENRECFL